jgi:deoxyribodipyrimidine photo-lyase
VIVTSILLEKEQFAARTIRPRTERRLDEFTKHVRNLAVSVPWNLDRKIKSLSFSPELIDRLHIDRSVSCASMFRGGTDGALGALRGFIRDRLSNYASHRNKPEIDGTSRLSPYLHFGQSGPHTIALAVRGAAAPTRDRDAFLEELIVRRELAVNLVRYNPRFKRLASVEPWAHRTIREDARDARAYHYTEKKLANAETHDVLWNAAERRIISSEWMHGYMRMYRPRKFLSGALPQRKHTISV